MLSRRSFFLAAPAFIAAPALMKIPRQRLLDPMKPEDWNLDHIVDAVVYGFGVVSVKREGDRIVHETSAWRFSHKIGVDYART